MPKKCYISTCHVPVAHICIKCERACCPSHCMMPGMIPEKEQTFCLDCKPACFFTSGSGERCTQGSERDNGCGRCRLYFCNAHIVRQPDGTTLCTRCASSEMQHIPSQRPCVLCGNPSVPDRQCARCAQFFCNKHGRDLTKYIGMGVYTGFLCVRCVPLTIAGLPVHTLPPTCHICRKIAGFECISCKSPCCFEHQVIPVAVGLPARTPGRICTNCVRKMAT